MSTKLLCGVMALAAMGPSSFAGSGQDQDAARRQAPAFGTRVEAEGPRLHDGTVLARRFEAKPNDGQMLETQVVSAAHRIEREWLQAGSMYVDIDRPIGPIISYDERVVRVAKIMQRLLPIDAMSDDELAVILGHELAHFTYEHSRRAAKSGMWKKAMAGLGAGLVTGMLGGGAAGGVANMTALLGTQAWTNGYSRELEDQADRVGLRYAYEAGFDVTAGLLLWARFQERFGQLDEVTNFVVSTHSRPSDRMANIEREIAINYRDSSQG